MLNDKQITDWERDGFLVLPELIDPQRCDELAARSAELVAAFDPSSHSTVFRTNEQNRVADGTFLNSGSRIEFFWEEDAFDEHNNLVVDPTKAINKFGHAQHDLDPTFSSFSRQSPLPELVADLGVANPKLLQSMLIFKQPRIGGEVGSHQDAAFLYTDPVTVIGLWFALEDATIDNGCLFAQPGGHRSPLRERFRRAASGGTEFVELDATPLPQLGEADLVPLEVPKGTCVVLHGLLPHGSHPNRSETSRLAYSLHIIDGQATYPDDNWLQRPDLPLQGF